MKQTRDKIDSIFSIDSVWNQLQASLPDQPTARESGVKRKTDRVVLQAACLRAVGLDSTISDDTIYRRLAEWQGQISETEWKKLIEKLQNRLSIELDCTVLNYYSNNKTGRPRFKKLRGVLPEIPTLSGRGGQETSSQNSSVKASEPEFGCLGRDVQLRVICEAMLIPNPKPVLVYGGPGIGKTTLKQAALLGESVLGKSAYPSKKTKEALQSMETHFGKRRYWVKANKAYDADSLVQKIGEAIGLSSLDPDPTVAKNDLLRHLHDVCSPIALAIDNIETPLGLAKQPKNAPEPNPDTEAETKELLREIGEISNVAVLASFRGEVQTRAGIFWRGIRILPLDPKPAIDLFLAVANRLDPAPKHDGVKTLVEQVENIPLAVVLLASYAETAGSFEELQRAWKQRGTKIMEYGGVNSWKGAMQFSLESPLIKNSTLASRLVRLMGRLPGGVAKTDAPKLLNSSESETSATSDLLVSLGLALNSENGSRRRMRHPIREFLRDTEDYAPDEPDWSRTSTIYLDILDTYGPQIAEEDIAINRIKSEIENISYILEKEINKSNSNIDYRLRLQHYGRFVSFTTKSGIEALQKFVTDDTHSNPDSNRRRGNISLRGFHLDDAENYYKRAIELFRNLDDTSGEASSVLRLGDVYLRKFQLFDAEKLYQEAISLFKSENDFLGIAKCIRRSGSVCFRRGQIDDAEKLYEEAISLYRSVENKQGEEKCIKSLGDIASWRGDITKARSHFDDALRRCIESGTDMNQAKVLFSLSYLPDMPEVQASFRERALNLLDSILTAEECKRFEEYTEASYRPRATPN